MYLPKRDTMHLRNKTVLWALACFLLVGSVFSRAQTQKNQGTPAAALGSVQPTPLPGDVDPSDPALPVWARPATPPPSAKATTNTPPSAATGNVPSNQPQPSDTGTVGQVTKGQGGGFLFKKRVENVTLPVTVMDDKHHIVTNLQKNDFVVYEDGQPQEILECRREDIPVSLGILVDNSGSMREKRAAITKAVVNLIRASNPSDEAFVVNFNDEPYMDQDFTSNVSLMHEALDRLDSRGGTALYDAVIASADHLAKAAKRDKKVLLVITDGEDNESRESLEQAIRAVQDENGPTIYTIGILGSEGKQRRAKRALEAMSLQTGGVAFFPKNLEEVDEISQQVAHDIRNQYNIVYKPSSPKEGYHALKVVARASGYKDLQVRTKSGYFSGQQQASKQ